MNALPKGILKNYFLESINQYFINTNKSTNPFLIKSILSGAEYYIFLKNISPAYFKNSPDITRIQIAKNQIFEEIKNSDEICIPVGYDCENDIFVIWNPLIFILRINQKNNISIYSRLSEQKRCNGTDLKYFTLSNGESVCCVNPNYLGRFLLNIESRFITKEFSAISAKLEDIILDKKLLDQINTLLSEKQILYSIQLLIGCSEKTNRNLSINDAFKIINLQYKKLYGE